MKKQLLLIICIWLGLSLRAQHNSTYSQYMFNGLLLNPAYAGSQEALNLTALYRRQWLGIGGAPSTLSFGAHTPLKRKKVSVGIILEQENMGLFNQTRTGLVYAYRFRFLKGHLSFGAQFGARVYAYDQSSLKVKDAYDPGFSGMAVRIIRPDFGAGAYYHDKNVYAGLAAPSLMIDGNNRYHTFTFNTGGVIVLSPDTRIKPALLVKYINGSPLSLNVSGTFYYRELLGLGLGYTLNSSAMAYADIRLNDQLYFGYAYERALNRLGTYTLGSHEVMLRYLFRYRINAVNARYF